MRRLQVTWPEAPNGGYEYVDQLRGRHGAGMSLLDYYTDKHAGSGTRAEWEQRIAGGQVAVNGVLVGAEYVVRRGDRLAYTRPPWPEPPAPDHVDVVYEDAHMVALHKPSGLQVLPGAMFMDHTVLGILQQHYGAAAQPAASGAAQQQQQEGGLQPAGSDGAATMPASSQSPLPQAASAGADSTSSPSSRRATCGRGVMRVPAPVHRLGRGTSGLLLCAVTEDARKALAAAMTHVTAVAAAAADGGGSSSSNKVAAAGSQLAACSHAPACGTRPEGPPVTGMPGAAATGAASADVEGGCSPLLLRKFYRALVQGLVDGDEGTIDVPIGPVPYPGVAGGLHAARPEGGEGARPATSCWRVLHRDAAAGSTLLEVEILTGRPHQIRIHCAALGHPLVGEPLYAPGGRPRLVAGSVHGADAADAAGTESSSSAGGPDPAAAAYADAAACGRVGVAVLPGDCGYLLHSHVLLLTHPVTGGPLRLEAPPPPELCTPEERRQRQQQQQQ